MASNTLTVQRSIDWSQWFVGQRPFSLNTKMEPALTSANLITQLFLSPPFKWRWNRNTSSFLTIDPAAVWIATHVYALGYRFKDTNGNMQTVTSGGTSGSTQPTWASVGSTTSDGSVVWTTSLITDYKQSIADFGFIEKAFLVPVTASATTAGNTFEIPNISTELTMDSGSGRPTTIAPYLDDNAGNITFRFMPGLPDQAYTVTVIYQKQPVLLTGLTGAGGTWAIPDRYSSVYNWGMLSFFYMFADDARFPQANQKFISGLLALAEGLNEQQINVFLGQWDFLIQSMRNQAKESQGMQDRSL